MRRLRDRGMSLASEERAAWALESIGYYRLSGYWYPYREMKPAGNGQRLDTFSHGTTFDEVLALYEFDRSLKLLVQQGIERVEVAVRSRIGHHLGEMGPLAHLDARNFRDGFAHEEWCEIAMRRVSRVRSRDDTVRHHDQNYGGVLPIWVLTDLLDFSDLSKLFKGMRSSDQQVLSDWFGVTRPEGGTRNSRQAWNRNHPLANWLLHLSIVRNICAHHGRLWNRQLTPVGVSTHIRHLRAFADLHAEFDDAHASGRQAERVFVTICILTQLLEAIDPASGWRSDVDDLLSRSFPVGGQRSWAELGIPAGTAERLELRRGS